jgi:hypothetical protein
MFSQKFDFFRKSRTSEAQETSLTMCSVYLTQAIRLRYKEV